MPRINKEENKSIVGDIESEGFEYAFVHYSNYDDIKDSQFHRLRKAFLEARKDLADYLNYKE